MRTQNPVIVRKPGPRLHQNVRVLPSSAALPAGTGVRVIRDGRWHGSSERWHDGGGWWRGDCGSRGCGWPWYSGIVPIAAPIPYLVETISPCRVPIDPNGRLVIRGDWAVSCFWPVYVEARMRWGTAASSMASDVQLMLMPDAATGFSDNGAEVELRRRIELAIATLLNADGIPTPYPEASILPRPAHANRIDVPWIRALMTGWT